MALKLEDNINRSMRANLVFKIVREDPNETYESTKQTVAKLLAENLGWDLNSATNAIIRAHRSGKKYDKVSNRAIFTKFSRDDVADNIESGFIELRKKGHQNNIRCSKQFTQQLQAKRNKALSVRHELKKDEPNHKGLHRLSSQINGFQMQIKYVKHSEY